MLNVTSHPQAIDRVGQFFGDTAQDIRSRATRSAERELDGQRATREDSYTDELIDQLGSTLKERVTAVWDDLRSSGVEIRVDFEGRNLPVTDETRLGADIGLRVTLDTPEATCTKAALVQCKRMYGPSGSETFPELKGRGETQARSMLQLTPAAVFMLYNFGDQQALVDYTSVPVGSVCPQEDWGPIPAQMRAKLGSRCGAWASSSGSIWDLGIAILPATRVLALSHAAQKRNKPFPITATTILRGCLPFGVFMTDLFASCFFGDVREEIVRAVTGPQAQAREAERLGLAVATPMAFMCRSYLNITITTRER